MTADVDICNMALGRISSKTTIASLTDSSFEATQCSIYYAQVRDQVLRSYNWNFARVRVTLAQIGTNDPSDRFAYAYAYPADCLAVRVINDRRINAAAPAHLRPKFEIATQQDDEGQFVKVLLTDENPVRLIYTRRVDNPGLFDPSFVAAFSWALAAELAMPILGKPDLVKLCSQGFGGAVAEAKAQNALEQYDDDDLPPSWIVSRTGFMDAAYDISMPLSVVNTAG